jgi:NAD(P) transhydrogenase
MASHHYDLIVIGSGPAGEKAATQAACLGKKVALVEKEPVLGGTVANLGTLPSKTMRETAAYLVGYRQRGIHGVTLTLEEHVGAQDLLHRERLVRQLEQARIRAHLENSKVTLYHGVASFADPHAVRVASAVGAEEMLVGNTILIATGGRPYKPAFFPEKAASLFDSETILNLTNIPKTLLIFSAGVVGCEYASIFAALGVKVTLLDSHARLLPFLDSDVSEELLSSMRVLGIDVRLNEEVVGYRAGAMSVLALASGSALSADALLVSVGRKGNTESLLLESAGLKANQLGLLEVNENYQTAQPHIYAVGDVTGFPSLASSAREQAYEAVLHAFAPEKCARTPPFQPYGIYTIPECSMVGETEDALRREGVPIIVGKAHYSANARGQIIGARSGFVKLIFHKESSKLLGVHAIGEQACELVHTGLMAMQMGAGMDLFLKTCFNYPTLGDLYKSAALDALAKSTPSAPPASLLKPGI